MENKTTIIPVNAGNNPEEQAGALTGRTDIAPSEKSLVETTGAGETAVTPETIGNDKIGVSDGSEEALPMLDHQQVVAAFAPVPEANSTGESAGKPAVSRRLMQAFKPRLRNVTVFGITLVLLFLVGSIGAFFSETQQPVAMKVSHRLNGYPVNEPIKVTFNQTLKDVKLELTPKVNGSWNIQRNFLGVKQAVFHPKDKKLAEATQYAVKLVDAQRVALGKSESGKEVDLVTEFAPGIISVSPLPGSRNMKTDQAVEVVFSEPRSGQTEPVLSITPAVDMEKSVSTDKKTYTWRPKIMAQTTTYTATASLSDKQAKLVETSFETVRQPNIVTATSKNYFYPEEKLAVAFDLPMKTDQPAFTCQCEGKGAWDDSQHFTFTPANLQPGKSYTYTVPKGLRSDLGGVREGDQPYVISTPGAVIASVANVRDASQQAATTIRFDQPVKRETVQPRLSVSPQAELGLSWKDDKTAVVNLAKMDSQTTYTINVAPGVEPQRLGLPGLPASGTIMTAAPTVKLPVPYFRQTYALSCEEASLRMALAYRGVYVSDMDILQRVGYSPRPLDAATNTWDDPNQMFVGNVNGSQAAKTGYGVYAPPIARVAQSFGRNAAAAVGISPQFLAQAIHQGNPVVIWGSARGAGASFSWNTPGGGTATGWVNQHAKTVFGVVGKPAAPIGFYIHDPIGGTKYWSTAQVMADLNSRGNLSNQAVVVY